MNRALIFILLGTSASIQMSTVRTVSAQGATTMLPGEWKLDVEATVEALEAADMARAAEVYHTLTGITVTFNEDGTATSELEIEGVRAVEHVREGRWEAIGEKHQNGVAILDVEFQFGREPHKVRYEFLDRDRLRMIPQGEDNATPFRIFRRTMN